MDQQYIRHLARMEFDKARKDAVMLDVVNRLRGRSTKLISFEEMHAKLGGVQGRSGMRREIPLDAIIGSVGRYSDFNRDFLPLAEHDKERWSGVKVAMETKSGIPPIDVYQVGEVYFVIDGNHRVSIAKTRGDTHIMASITEIKTRVGLTPDNSPKDLVCKAEVNNFLEETRLDESIGDVNFEVSEIGHYKAILQQIEAVRLLKAEEGKEDYAFVDASRDWYLDHYLPVIDVLREQNFLRYYPNRTETDLYIWLVENRQTIEEEFGWTIQLDSVAAEMAVRKNSRAFMRNTMKQFLKPEQGTGGWRERQLGAAKGKMFADVVVVLENAYCTGPAISNALTIAAQEDAHLLGLVINEEGSDNIVDFEAAKAAFAARCREAGVFGQLAAGTGKQEDILKARTRWADLVVLPPPPPDADPKIYHELLEHIHIPVLIARAGEIESRRILLAYNDSPKSREALFLAAYLCSLWGMDLSVIAVEDGGGEDAGIEAARTYLKGYALDANFITAQAPVVPAILNAAETEQADFVITGSYQAHKFGRHNHGSTLDTLLAESTIPMLICR
jgi:nucleotide-binding universal stress UspA family protein